MGRKYPEDPKGLIDESFNGKAGTQAMWDQSILFLEGDQWLEFNREKRMFTGFDSRSRRFSSSNHRLVINLLSDKYRTVLSRLALSMPGVVGVPSSDSPEDITKSKASELAFRYHWMSGGLKTEVWKAVEWLLTCGTAALFSFYDKDADEVFTRTISPYDLFLEPDIRTMEESDWMCFRAVHLRDDLADKFENHADFIKSATGNVGTREQDQQADRIPKDRVEAFEWHWRDGRTGISVDSRWIWKGERDKGLPFPIRPIKYQRIPRRIWGMGFIYPLIELQWLYNRTVSRTHDNLDLVGNPAVLNPRNSGIGDGMFNDQPGKVFTYNTLTGPPSYLLPPAMPAWIQEVPTRIEGDMNSVAGIHSVTQGRRAVGVTSGRAIEKLTERDLSQLMTTQNDVEEAVEEQAKLVIMLMQRHYKKSRWVRMMDSTGRWIHGELKATDLGSVPEVTLEAGSIWAYNAEARDERIMQKVQMGLMDPAEAMRELSTRVGNEAQIKKVKSISHARFLLKVASTVDPVTGEGMAIEIYMTDDLETITEVFQDFMRTEEYYGLPEERQDYISDIFTSVVTSGLPPEAYQAAIAQRTVFPRSPMPQMGGASVAGEITAMGSPTAQQQVATQAVGVARDIGTVEAATSRNAQRTEALTLRGGSTRNVGPG